MKNKQQDISDLFSMFHDFDIISIDIKDEVLTLGIIIPWGEIWDIEDYKITVKLLDLLDSGNQIFKVFSYLNKSL